MALSSNKKCRCSRPAAVVWLTAGLAVLLCTAQTHADDDSIRALIQQAGNANSDEARLDYLKQLRKQPDLEESFKGDLDKLIMQIDRWQNDKQMDYFGGEVKRNKDFDFKIAETSALYPLTWLYRGRMVIWYAMESGGIWNIPERRREFFAIACGFFEKYAGAFPENKIALMYLGISTGGSRTAPTRPYPARRPGRFISVKAWNAWQISSSGGSATVCRKTAGTEAWCAARLGGLASVIAKYRFLTGEAGFDELLVREMSPYMRFRMHGEPGRYKLTVTAGEKGGGRS